MTTPCGYYVGANDLTTIFKGYLYGTKLNNSGFNSTNYGEDISEIFQPATSPAEQIAYNTDYKSNGLGGLDLKNYFMDINYPVVQLTASGFNTTLSAFTNSGSGGTPTITDTTGMIVFSTTGSSTGSLTVTNFPPTAILYVLVVGGGGGGGGGGAQANAIAYHAGSGGGGGGGYFNTGVLSSGNTYTIDIGSGGGGGNNGSGTDSYTETHGGIVYYYNVGNGGSSGGSGASTSCVGGSVSIVAVGGIGGGGGSGSGSSSYHEDLVIYGDGGSGGSGTENGGGGDNGDNDEGGSVGSPSIFTVSSYVYYARINDSYNLFYGGGGGGGATAVVFGNTGCHVGGMNAGGSGGASANNSAEKQRTGFDGEIVLSSWTSFTPEWTKVKNYVAPNNLLGICVGGGGGGGSGGMTDGQSGFDGGSGSQGIAIVWWSVA
jgi:hypothetical protein